MLTVNSHSHIAGTPPCQAGRRLLRSTAPTAPAQELEGALRLPYNEAPTTVGGRTGSTAGKPNVQEKAPETASAMRSQRVKDLYYLIFAKLSILSLYWNKLVNGKKFSQALVHLGCGIHYLPGMLNIDANIFRKTDIWLDITLGLPFHDDTISGIYASHVVEHLNVNKVRKLFSEFHRVLIPGGAIRLVVPSLEYAIQAYVDGNYEKLGTFPETYRSLGGRFNNFTLCANQHLIIFDFSFLAELLGEAGFGRVVRKSTHHSDYFKAEHLQFEPDDQFADGSLCVEGWKGVGGREAAQE